MPIDPILTSPLFLISGPDLGRLRDRRDGLEEVRELGLVLLVLLGAQVRELLQRALRLRDVRRERLEVRRQLRDLGVRIPLEN